MDEAVDQLNVLTQTLGQNSGLGRLKRNGTAAADVPAVTVLCRQLIAGVLISDLLIDRLSEVTGHAREQVLDELAGDVPRQLHLQEQRLRVLQVELSGGCTLLQGPDRGPYAALGPRIEQLLGLAEEQATAIVDAAPAEAAGITSPASAQQPCPRCGAS